MNADQKSAEEREARTGLGRLLKNSASSQGLQAAEVLVFLGLTPFIVNTLGVEQYGVWGVIWATIGLFAMVDLGFGRAIVKFIADARGQDDDELLRRTVSTLFWVFTAQAAVLIPVTAGLLFFFDNFFNTPVTLEAQAKHAFLLAASGAIAALPLAMFRGVLVAHQDTWVGNLYHLGGLVLYSCAVLFFLPSTPTLTTLAYLNLVRTVGTPLLIAAHSLRRTPGTTIRLKYFDREFLGRCWRYSSALLLIHLTSLLGVHLDIFIIQAALPVTAVALYAVAARVSLQVNVFTRQVEAVIEPIVAELHGAGDTARLSMIWLNGTRYTIGFATPLILGCAVLCRPLLLSWMGDEFGPAVLPLQLLLLSVWVAVIHGNSHIQLSMRGDQKFLAAFTVLGQALNVVASMALVGSYGLAGVAGATLFVPLAADVLIQRKVCQRLEVGMISSYIKSLGPSLIPTAVMILVQWQLLVEFKIDSLFEVALAEMVGALVFWYLFWLLGMSRDEKGNLLARFKGRLARS